MRTPVHLNVVRGGAVFITGVGLAKHTFWLTMSNATPCGSCHTFLRAVAYGLYGVSTKPNPPRLVVLPRVEVFANGTWSVVVLLKPAPDVAWHLLVTLEWWSYQINVKPSFGAGCVLTSMKERSASDPYKLQSLDLPMPRVGVTPPSFSRPCSHKALDVGLYRDESDVRRPSMSPLLCELQRLTKQRAVEALRGKWIVFLGDSTCKELLAILLCHLLGVNPEIGHPSGHMFGADIQAVREESFPAWDHLCRDRDRFFDTKPGSLPEGIRLTLFWNGAPNACGNFEGLNSFDGKSPWSETWLTGLRQVLSGAGEGRFASKPDVVVFNSGLHDSIRGGPHEFSIDDYEKKLKLAWSLLKSHAIPHYIWRSTSSKFVHNECPTPRKDGSIGYTNCGQPGFKMMNDIAHRLATNNGASILDAWALRYISPLDGDGMHCENDPSCVAQVEYLLRLIELGPEHN